MISPSLNGKLRKALRIALVVVPTLTLASHAWARPVTLADLATGNPYQIRGALSLDAGSDLALPQWTDVLTFSDAARPIVTADFVERLDGLLSAKHDGRMDFTAGLENISAAHGVQVQAESGTQYAVHVPEPGTSALLAFGLFAIVGFRRARQGSSSNQGRPPHPTNETPGRF